jgi:hypothetical protein
MFLEQGWEKQLLAVIIYLLLMMDLCLVFSRLGFLLHTADNLGVITLYNRTSEKLIVGQFVNKSRVLFIYKTIITESTRAGYTSF